MIDRLPALRPVCLGVPLFGELLPNIVLRYTVLQINLSRKQAMGTDGYAHCHESWTGWDNTVRVPVEKPWVKGSHAY